MPGNMARVEGERRGLQAHQLLAGGMESLHTR